MAKTPLTADNVMMDGGILYFNEAVTTDAVIQSKVALNKQHRNKVTLTCDSSVSGAWSILDVDTNGRYFELIELAVIGGTPSVYSHNHTVSGIFCRFTPSSAVSETVYLRALFGTS